MLQFYRYLSIVLIPIIFLLILFRIYRNKEDKVRFLEKFAFKMKRKPKGEILWFNAASMGELKSLLPLLYKLEEQGQKLLITTTTITSAKYFSTLKLNAIHQFAPLDNPAVIKRFLKHWQPKILFLTDSELWPNLLHYTAKHCDIILLNARLSDKSFKRWQKVESIAKQIFSNIQLIIPSSQKDKEKFSYFSANIATFYGNMKYLAPPLAVDAQQLRNLSARLTTKNIICYASTHPGEDEFLLKVHQQLMIYKPDLLGIIIPRHPHRGKRIAQYVKTLGLNAQLRSINPLTPIDTQIYIGDTMGDLGLFFRLAPIVVMGKSFKAVGGHNILEPALLDSAIIIGPNYQNFTNIVEDFLLHDAIMVAEDEYHLKATLLMLLADSTRLKQLQHNAKQMMQKNNVLLTNILKVVNKYTVSKTKVAKE